MGYAYNSRPTVNTNPWMRAMLGANQFVKGEYNRSPDMAYNRFLQMLQPSNTQSDSMKRLFDTIYQSWNDQNWRQSMGGGGSGVQGYTDWADYLGTYNFDRALAGLGTSGRRESGNARFNRPARIVQF